MRAWINSMATRGFPDSIRKSEVESPVSPQNRTVAAEWDKNAVGRSTQISSGIDFSRDSVIVPAMIRALSSGPFKSLLDIGCGDGQFISRIRDLHIARHFLGIDVSSQMVRLAQSRFTNELTSFRVLEAEQAADSLGRESFEAVTANMMLSTAPDLGGVIKSVSRVLQNRGYFVFSIPHPEFFHLQEPLNRYLPENFDPANECSFDLPFTISMDPNPLPSLITYYHRPIAAYLGALANCELILRDFLQPMPPLDLDPAYLSKWRMPRFLICKAIKNSRR
jgi:ubiquinone/menaquinone biosynthesis C-methylase UbiE